MPTILFIDIHLGKQFYFDPKPNKGYPSRSDNYNFLSILLKNRKNDEASSMDFKIESPIIVINDKNRVTDISTSNSPTVALIG